MLLTLTSSELISGAQVGWVTMEGPLEGDNVGLEHQSCCRISCVPSRGTTPVATHHGRVSLSSAKLQPHLAIQRWVPHTWNCSRIGWGFKKPCLVDGIPAHGQRVWN